MDPTLPFIQYRDSFKDSNPHLDLPEYFSLESKPSIKSSLTFQEYTPTNSSTSISSFYDLVNPFKVGNSIFMDADAVKMANIDVIFDLTDHIGGYLAKQRIEKFAFCDLYGAPGGFSQYLLWKRAEGYGYAMSHEETWNMEQLEKERFNLLKGWDGTGNLAQNLDWYIRYVRDTEGYEVDLVIGNGLDRDEITSSKKILMELIVGLELIKVEGNIVIRFFDINSKISKDLIYIVASCFEKVFILKPITTHPLSNERYVIGMKKRDNVAEYLSLLRRAFNKYTSKQYAINLIETLPEDFLNWISRINQEIESFQSDFQKKLSQLERGYSITLPQYNLYRALALWNLPDNNSNPIVFGMNKSYS